MGQRDERAMGNRKRKKPKSTPLKIGDVFVMRLADGRYGACRVVTHAVSRKSFIEKGSMVVAATQYIGDQLPTIDEPALRQLLVLTHHFYVERERDICALWLEGSPPKAFKHIGTIEPNSYDQNTPCNSFADWSYFPIQVLMQWRWDHERDRVLAEDNELAREEEERQMRRERRKQEELSKMTYVSFRKRKLFRGWREYPPAKMIAASRRIMNDTSRKLEALGSNADCTRARAILAECIVAFNRLDDENDHWIETVEREDICEHFYELAHIAGFKHELNLADEWRDW